MNAQLLKKYDSRVPRYTSYPTAPLFHSGVNGDEYGKWLEQLGSEPLSLYAHVPFCDTLCWFCGCTTKIVNRYDPVSRFVPSLLAEIDMVADRIGTRRDVGHMHWGGGSPTMLRADDISRVGEAFHNRFNLLDNAEFAVEIDPRGLGLEAVKSLADIGLTRASIGLQDVNKVVQEAINRVQTMEETCAAVYMLASNGIADINIDLIYGLPYQTTNHVRLSVEAALSLEPARVVLFGYAHVPSLKKHQRLIPNEALPGAPLRMEQATVAAEILRDAGYVEIGLDHFARPDDTMALALEGGSLHRNFQGYTTDTAETLIGFGPSAIGTLPNAYVQNTPSIHEYSRLIGAGSLATGKGVALNHGDIVRRAVIERLMCDHKVDLATIRARFGLPIDYFATELSDLSPMLGDEIITYNDEALSVTELGAPFVRVVAAIFDQYFRAGEGKFSKAV